MVGPALKSHNINAFGHRGEEQDRFESFINHMYDLQYMVQTHAVTAS